MDVPLSPTPHARRTPDRPAVVMAGSGDALTYAELERSSVAIAGALAGCGLVPGDAIALLLGNEPAYLEVAWAAQRSGLRYVPVNWHLGPEEVRYIVGDSGARVLVSSGALADLADAALAGRDDIARLLVDGDAPGWQDLRRLAAEAPTAPAAETEGQAMYYSSGTTGRPKGIVRPGVTAPFGTGAPIDLLLGGRYGFDQDTVFLSPAPLYHAAPLAWSMGTHRRGGTTVVMEAFDAEAMLRAIERYRVTHAQLVPTMFVRLLKLPAEVRSAYDTSSLRVVVHGAAPCPIPVKEQMLHWWGPIIHEFYGGSEGTGFVAIGPDEWMERKGSVGRTQRGAIHVLDDDGRPLPPGEPGLVWFEGATRFEYHGDPVKTAAAFDHRGWTTLGDIGYLDEDGYLFLTDRATDMIISGGVNIYPQEVEQALILHPAVLDVGVVGVPHPEFGETVVAFVEPVPEVTPSPALAEELSAHAAAHLARFKCPRRIEFVESMPRLPTGKLLRRRLRDLSASG